MLPTFDATPGGPAATSVVSVEDADTMLALRPGGAPNWADADDAARELALMRATAILERERWVGTRASEAQQLAWPRLGTDVLLEPLPSGVVPGPIQVAAAELAERLLASNGTADPTTPDDLALLAGLNLKAGPVSLDLTKVPSAQSAALTPGGTLPPVVRHLVEVYLRPPTPVALSTLRVVRAA